MHSYSCDRGLGRDYRKPGPRTQVGNHVVPGGRRHPPGTHHQRIAIVLTTACYPTTTALMTGAVGMPLKARTASSCRCKAKGLKMATQRAIDKADIQRRINKLAEAIRDGDVDALMYLYAPDIVSFD